MAAGETSPPEPFDGTLSAIDLPVLREYIEDAARWAIGEVVGAQVGAEQRDALADPYGPGARRRA